MCHEGVHLSFFASLKEKDERVLGKRKEEEIEEM